MQTAGGAGSLWGARVCPCMSMTAHRTAIHAKQADRQQQARAHGRERVETVLAHGGDSNGTGGR
eukprot:scaffold69409_cov18-Tisochrysis_lutea.AAC.1